MRVALISDLHGNEHALEAVLADIAEEGVDEIVCLGDTATLGPRPREVLAKLRGIRCRCIVGNHDAFMLEPDLIRTYSEAPIVIEAVDWCRAQLDNEDLAFIRTFVPTIEIALGGGSQLFLFHGTPRSHMEDVLATTPASVVDEMLAGRRATVMAGGHTHLQMLRQHRGILLANPGSVGMPFEAYASGGPPKILAHAEWACVGADARGRVDVWLRRVPLDRAKLRAQAAAVEHPLAKDLVAQYT